MSKTVALTANIVAAFVQRYLLSKYDQPVPIPPFHKEMWDLVINGKRRVAIAAPRKHAKSTAITHALTLAMFLFRHKKYGIIVSEVQDQAIQFLGDIKNELIENEQLRKDFKVRRIVKDSVTDVIFEFEDGEQFRIAAFGAEQRVRGRKWRNTRPDWIVCDDLEGDEQVDSDERRKKFRNWFFKALVPIMSSRGQIVIVGTILHMDSVLMRLQRQNTWTRKLYRAHRGFDDFSERLWPAQWSEEALREERQVYIEDGNSSGYAQEYLNDPTANDDAFFRKSDFKELTEDMKKMSTNNYAGVDLAISEEDKRAYTVIVVGGMDQHKQLHVKHVLRFRGDALQIMDALFSVQQTYDIQAWKMEDGQIKQTMLGPLYEEMQRRNIYLNLSPANPGKSKRKRAAPIQARMRAGGVYFDKTAEWYETFELELLQFDKGMYKDQVDAFAWLGIAINELAEGPTDQEKADEDYEEEMSSYREQAGYAGANLTTGY